MRVLDKLANAIHRKAVDIAEFNNMRTCFKCKNWCFDKDREPDFYCGLSKEEKEDCLMNKNKRFETKKEGLPITKQTFKDVL